MKTETATPRDLDELTALNRDYIHSVQHGDVRRFDEILAADFLCSNPDGSLVDKNQFLEQTARPVTISGLSVHEVRVRILGDIAIIHARTSGGNADLDPLLCEIGVIALQRRRDDFHQRLELRDSMAGNFTQPGSGSVVLM